MTEGGAVSARDQSARLEEALADNASLRRHASSVAHDFNNLLAVITGYTEMMLKRLRADDPLRRNAEAIKRATEWGAALAQQILSGSRRTIPAPVPVDLNQLVGNVTRVLQPLLGDSIELVTRLSPSLARVSANPHRIGQVIMNLVVNARDAMPSGGRLTIETSNVGQAVMLAVGDTGYGMDDETRARLFEPYFTTKEPGRGSGLGLASVYDVVTQCGGQISVTSDAGAGSTFKIYFPRVPETATLVEAPAPPPAPAAAAEGRTVLVVENEREVRDLIREILQLQNYVVLEAGDRDEALALSQQHGSRIDLMVVDVGIPPSFADEWVVRVRASRPEIKVLYVSGYLSDSASAEAPKLGPLLQKPFTVGAFTKAIGLVLGRAK
ncbi:MAG: hybrid sensor histidine kinase/response regulator [Candidatus Rokuibacteriota bacterium]|nr:MAG: hybrid sensor histidine kinase/response regulator [Candidatus Rokubacteria bacterium]